MNNGRSERVSARLSGRVVSASALSQVKPHVGGQLANDSLASEGSRSLTTYVSTQQVQMLAAELTDREWQILLVLERVRLASGHQLQRLYFVNGPSAERHCRRVLARLTDAHLIARLDRQIGGRRAGSAGYVYALDRVGQRIVGARGPAGGRRQRRPWTPGWPFLTHGLLVTETYVGLIEAERTGPIEVLDWIGEPRCWRSFAGAGGARVTLKPDAAVRIGIGRYEDHWFIEVDRGTESPATIARKLDVYRSYRASGRAPGTFPRVLWLAPNAVRRDQIAAVIGHEPASSSALHTVRTFDAFVTTVEQGAGV